ncbi:hypothetical protein M407DRAFT_231804 [Tulasnella calospora MUT 4182]|uniref:DUF6533 domain-containing protein n=1 Tax=Tulasnella calospora MUT 4182 TaxID=1051891 RepID=A0A0C3MIY5_9AGAM|nr:hypothetical protein M407DRAFT_231804 [Tulasnella calospora MUT 4182]
MPAQDYTNRRRRSHLGKQFSMVTRHRRGYPRVGSLRLGFSQLDGLPLALPFHLHDFPPFTGPNGFMDDVVATYAGAATLAIWDWLICWKLEYQFIWKARLSAGKFLYLIHRYPLIITSLIGLHFNTAHNIPIAQCQIWIPLEYCFDILVVAFVQGTYLLGGLLEESATNERTPWSTLLSVTLLLRVYALYEKNRCVIIFLSLLFCISLASTLTFYAILIQKFFYYPGISPLVGCLPDCQDCYSWIPAIHLPLLIFDTMVLGFTLKKCLQFFTTERSLFPTLTIVFRDGLIYYVVTFALMIFNIAFLYSSPASMSYWFIPWMRSIVAIMGTRLLLNLRGQIEEQRADETGFMLHPVDLNDSVPSYAPQPTSPTTPHSGMTWGSFARRARSMSVHDHDPQRGEEVEDDSPLRASEEVMAGEEGELEMTKVKSGWKLGSSSKLETYGDEPETPTPPPRWRGWKCPKDNPSWL